MTFEEKLRIAASHIERLRDENRARQRHRHAVVVALDQEIQSELAHLKAALKARDIIDGRVRSTTIQERLDLERSLDAVLGSASASEAPAINTAKETSP